MTFIKHSAKRLAIATLSLALCAPVAGMAQIWDPPPGQQNTNTGNNSRENAYAMGQQRGYQDGYSQGQQERNNNNGRGRRNRGRGNSQANRNDTNGYDRSMGPKGQYKKGYRDAYDRGYSDGVNGNAAQYPNNYPNGTGYPNNYPNGTQYPNNYPNNGNGGYDANALVRAAQDNGYRDGQYYGEQDRSAGRASNATSTKGYRDADHGYDRSLGSETDFKRLYREAFVQGYSAGYNGNASGWPNNRYPNDGGYPTSSGYPNNGGYGNATQLVRVAQDNGYRDGVFYGQQDRAGNHSSRPTQVKGYEDADHGYTSSLGSKDEYKRVYRDAFVQGYQNGYNGRR